MRLNRRRTHALLILLLLIAAWFRLAGVRWDEGRHLHPDERFTSMVEERISFPSSIARYFDSPRSPLNPYNKGFGSFVYGTFPLFLAKAVAALFRKTGYDGTYLVGRLLSALFDLITVWVTYRLARHFTTRATALGAAALLAFCPMGIQLSHFWGVDTFLTTFSALALLGAVRLAKGKSRLTENLAMGFSVGLAVACKVTGLALLAPVGFAVLIRILRPPIPNEPLSLGKAMTRAAEQFLLIVGGAAAMIRIALPYAFLGPSPFSFRLDHRYLQDLKSLSSLTKSFAGFPPMLQWAGRTVFFPFGDFVLWGAGLLFGIPALVAVLWAPVAAWRRRSAGILIAWIHILVVFGYHATSSTKNVRYFYPAYPALAVLASLVLATFTARTRARLPRLALPVAVLGTLLFGFAFSSIYRRPNARVAASRWIYEHVPPATRFANEDWDDGLPMPVDGRDSAPYAGPSLHPYDPDTLKKVGDIVRMLEETNWIAITSNRAYGSVTRVPQVFPMTTAYYRALFEGRLGFDRLADFSSYPALGPLSLPDDSADESFTVYDHPRVLLFRKNASFSSARVRSMLLAAMPTTPITMDEWQKWPRSRRSVAIPVLPLRGPGLRALVRGQPTEHRMASLPAAIFFYLAILIIGGLAFPLSFVLFSRLADRGAGLARILGLVLTTYLLSLAAEWRLLPNGRGGAVASLTTLALLSAVTYKRYQQEIRAFWRERRRLLLTSEVTFAVGFLLFTGLRALNPEIFWGEKPMDFSILNILVRARSLPASDPWFAGAPLRYYTFGQEMVAFLTLLTGLSTRLTFNLAFGLLGGTTLQAAFSLARNWAGTRRAAIAAASFVAIVGNFSGLREWLLGQPGRGELRHLDWHYFWATSRVIRDTINEYPFWSLTFADLHAHVLAMPLFLLMASCGFNLVRVHQAGASRLGSRVTAAALFGFAVAAQALANTWDVPLLAGLLLLVPLVAGLAIRSRWGRTIGQVCLSIFAATSSAVLLVLPLWVHGGGKPGFGRNAPSEAGARGMDILTQFGLFFFLAIVWWLVSAHRRLQERGLGRTTAGVSMLILATGLAGLAVLWPNAFCLVAILLFLIAAITMTEEPADRLAFGFIGTGLFLVFFAQRFFIWDRMNTFFKLYFEAWLLLAIATSVLVFRSRRRKGSFAHWAWPLRALFFALLGVGLFTTVTGARGAVSRNRPSLPDGVAPGPASLDGLAYLERWHPGEYKAVMWMWHSIDGTPVVLEAQGPSYRDFGRISMLTGLPTVLGWDYHVLQRGNPQAEIDVRKQAVREIYSSPKPEAVEPLLRRYHVGYVYVGWLEKKTYPAVGLLKFHTAKDLFELAYENPEAKLYRVSGGDTEDIVLPAKESLPRPDTESKAAQDLREPETLPEIRDTPEANRAPYSGMREPRDAAVDDRGRLWIADFGNSRLRIFDSEGGYLGGWGGRSDGTHGFNELCGVSIQGQNLYIADTWNGRVELFTLSGEWKAMAKDLYGPRGVAVAPDSRVWVTDTGNHRLLVYDSRLENPIIIGKKGNGPGQFDGPVGIAIGPNGAAYVADTLNRRIEAFDPEGHFLRAWPVVGWQHGIEPHIEVDNETVYVSDPSGESVFAYDPLGSTKARWTVDSAGRKFARPTGLALDRKKRILYIINSGDNSVAKINLSDRRQ